MQGRGKGSRRSLHCVVTKLSPVKCSKKNAKIKYFAGKPTDGKSIMQMVSFQPQLRSQLQAPLDAATSVALSECQVKEGGFQKGLEIVAASRSKVLSSPKEFKLPCDLSRIDPDAAAEVHLKDVDNLAVMQSVTVRVKAVLVGMPENVQVEDSWRGLTKQECIVTDATETIRIVLWEKKIVYRKIGATRLRTCT